MDNREGENEEQREDIGSDDGLELSDDKEAGAESDGHEAEVLDDEPPTRPPPASKSSPMAPQPSPPLSQLASSQPFASPPLDGPPGMHCSSDK